MYTRLVWFLWWLDAAAHFAVFNVDRESGRGVKVKKPRCRCFLRLHLLGSPFGFLLFCGVQPDAGASTLRLCLPHYMLYMQVPMHTTIRSRSYCRCFVGEGVVSVRVRTT